MRNMNVGAAIEVKEVSATGTIEGYGSTFGNVDNGFDVVEPGAFKETLEKRGLPKMLWGHNMFEPPIGKWDEAVEDNDGLYLKGSLNMEMQRGREVHSALKMGTLDGLSIGFMVNDSEVAKDGIRYLKSVDLFEVSVVTFPMNEEARVSGVKQWTDDMTERQFEGILRDAGFSRKQAMAIIRHGFAGLVTRDADDAEELAASFARLSQTLRG